MTLLSPLVCNAVGEKSLSNNIKANKYRTRCYRAWLFSFYFTILHSTRHLKCFLTPIHFLLSTHCYIQHFTVTMPILLCLDQRHTFHSLCLTLFWVYPFTIQQTNTLANPHKEQSPLLVPTYGRPGRHTREAPRSTPMPPPRPGPTG